MSDTYPCPKLNLQVRATCIKVFPSKTDKKQVNELKGCSSTHAIDITIHSHISLFRKLQNAFVHDDYEQSILLKPKTLVNSLGSCLSCLRISHMAIHWKSNRVTINLPIKLRKPKRKLN